ncbi:MAG: ABC transporter substrate-binding protein [Gammaproteobacteria bacterium]|nr:ABC transporter substrate-binding protein [Gammaproteobacteria bacterium]
MRSITIIILIAFVVGLHGCDRKPVIQASGSKIKVGIIAPLSGSNSSMGEEGLKGIKAAMQLQTYLQNGDAIELIAEDDRDDPSLSVKAVKKLAEEDQVAAILILSGSDAVLSVARLADDYNTPILAMLATHPDITRHSTFVSQLCFDDNFQGSVAALFVHDELLIDRIAIFSNPDSPYSSHLAGEFANKFKSIGGQVTDTISVTKQANDYTKILTSVRDSAPELLYLPIAAEELISIAKAAEKLDWKPKMMATDGLLATVVSEYKTEIDLLEDMLATDFASHGITPTQYGERLGEAYDSLYDNEGTTYTVLGAEGYAVLLDAMNRCEKSNNRLCINDMIRSTMNFVGVAGYISIDSNGKAHRPVFINSIQGGQMKYIVKVY